MSRDIKEVAAGLDLATSIFKYPEVTAVMQTQAFASKPSKARGASGLPVEMKTGPIGSLVDTVPEHIPSDEEEVPF